ncbi:MAG: HAMP domain-containing histidine kinase [Betaproteobacteria bacterium]|nr:HAMP domain-containing histidine kinase [Betaproteobacteria bacterium]
MLRVVPAPRSFLGLVLTGFALVALPFALALAYSAWSTQRVAAQSRSAVFNAAQAARASRALVNRVASLERLARQIVVLNAADLREDFRQAHRGFLDVARELGNLPLDAYQIKLLERTLAQEEELYQQLAEERGAGRRARIALREVAGSAADLADSAAEMLAVSHLVADREVEALRASAEAAQSRAVGLALGAAVLALVVAFALTRLIARPVGELDASIRRLGGGDFERVVQVSGPEDLRHLGDQLDWLRRRLVELEAQKNRFLRHLSHEFKTPLTALREGAELLNDQVVGPLAPQQKQVVTIMRENSVRLQRLIEDLLDYQRALHAAASLDLRQVVLDQLAREAAGAHALAAQAKGLHWQLDLQPVTIEADPLKMQSIADNLIGNAVKFTPEGGTVTVRVSDLEREVRLDVADTGPGVPPAERDAIFGSFFRGRAKSSGRVEGTGLGLAIVRELVEAHGGRVALLECELGAHFRVSLPRRVSCALPRAA